MSKRINTAAHENFVLNQQCAQREAEYNASYAAYVLQTMQLNENNPVWIKYKMNIKES